MERVNIKVGDKIEFRGNAGNHSGIVTGLVDFFAKVDHTTNAENIRQVRFKDITKVNDTVITIKHFILIK